MRRGRRGTIQQFLIFLLDENGGRGTTVYDSDQLGDERKRQKAYSGVCSRARSLRERFRDRIFGGGVKTTRRAGRRVWMGGRELLDADQEGLLKACAKEGRDCWTWVTTAAWLAAMVGGGRRGGVVRCLEVGSNRTFVRHLIIKNI